MATTVFETPSESVESKLEEGLAYRAVKSGNNWILPSGKNAANGDPVVLDGRFGYATAAIVGGTDAIIEDTNWKPYGDGGALKKLSVKTHSFSDSAILYKFGNVVAFAVRNLSPNTIAGYTIPQGYRPSGPKTQSSLCFLLVTYNGYGTSQGPCILWVEYSTGGISFTNANELVSGMALWITEE